MRTTAPALAGLGGIAHGFFGRRGGVSRGPFDSLNASVRNGDEAANVATNRRRIVEALGMGERPIVTGFQVHGTICLPVEAPWTSETAPEGDAVVTDRPGAVLGVLTADCAPVLLADPVAGVVAAAHAGWKGALDGIVEATVAGMLARGASAARIVAAVGPCIGPLSYEVGPEFEARFVERQRDWARFFTAGAGDRRQFDLKGFVAGRLAAAGVGTVDVLPDDTCAEEDRYFSFRRATRRQEKRFGLQLSVIALA
ncbi:MAG: peptidoglycan editing factor PgeF [Geminicoccaceae bacterium]